MMIQNIFSLGQKQSSHLFHVLMECMKHRESVSSIHVLSLGSLHFLLPFFSFSGGLACAQVLYLI